MTVPRGASVACGQGSFSIVGRPAAMARLYVPEKFNRNSKHVREVGPEKTGEILIRHLCDVLGLDDLSGTDVLDVGCGVRFTQTIINGGLPLKTYTGVDVDRPLIKFLRKNVKDERFRFAHWDVKNAMYHPKAKSMQPDMDLPIKGSFDVIWLLSVFTHMPPEDSDAMLTIVRRHIRPDGQLLFSCFVDPEESHYRERTPDQPGLHSHYSEALLRDMIVRNGWEIGALHDANPRHKFIQSHFVCLPV